MNSRLFLMLIVIGLTAGCAAGASVSPTHELSRDSPPGSETPVGRGTLYLPRPTISPGPDTGTASMLDTNSVTALATADLAARMNIPVEELEVVSVTADDFPASNLGCGEFSKRPDKPIPALVTGQRIVLTARGRRYVYHAHGTQIAYCGPLGD